MNNIGDVKDENILLLQGPLGSFFKKLDNELVKQGAKTYKIGFNGADSFYSNHYNYIPFRAKKEQWESFIKIFLKDNSIDKIFLFGDCRFYQSIAIKKAMQFGIDVFVFEEGYIRPDFITMERYGVNDFSHIPREADFYRALDTSSFSKNSVRPTNSKVATRNWSATIYYVVANVTWFLYPHYEHHRELNAIKEALYGVRNAFRKYLYAYKEKNLLHEIVKKDRKNYFFIPLQTFNDFQLLEHSHFESIEHFLDDTLRSFSQHSNKKHKLVIKHHPMDRGRKNYTKYIFSLMKKYSLEGRVYIVHDLHLPTLLDNAIGTVTINSTVGLSSVLHNTPTKVLGNAIYDIEGLTSKNVPLNDFWTKYQKIDKKLYKKYIEFLVENTQLNGSFYGDFPYDLLADNS